jgi:hypothetical protein
LSVPRSSYGLLNLDIKLQSIIAMGGLYQEKFIMMDVGSVSQLDGMNAPLNGFQLTTGATRIRDLKMRKLCLLIILNCCLVSTVVAQSNADEPRESMHHAAEREEGLGGASGQVAAWLFVIANFPVVLSLLQKACRKVMPQNANLKEAVDQIDLRQKRYLMKLHYWLNPIAVGVAIVHFLYTECKATAIPEIGLGAMLLVCMLGIMVTFKWSPASMRKNIYRIHTSSISLLAIVLILAIGHSMVD